jgi:ABC-type Na+ efflux pump permease subunit
MWPVVLRELRVSARRRGTYWLRVLAAAVAIATFALFASGGRRGLSLGGTAGAELFPLLHQLLLVTLAVLVPLMTMDCISSERREGTLGLLFLTNLNARQIIFAKAIAHGLRAVTLWAAVLPVMALPLLLGGVDWRMVALSSFYNLELIVIGLTVGLTVSVFQRGSISAFLLLASLMGGALLVYAVGNALLTRIAFGLPGHYSLAGKIEDGWGLVANRGGIWAHFFQTPAAPAQDDLFLWFLPGSAVLLAVAIWFWVILLGRVMRASCQDRPKTRRRQQTESFFLEPVFATQFMRRWLRRSLDRNPVGWLEKRSWSGRIAGWVWLGLMIFGASIFIGVMDFWNHEGLWPLFALMVFLLLSMAYVAANSFRRERETGALELLLVSPIRETSIIRGRVMSIWQIFLPAFLIWVGVAVFLSTWMHVDHIGWWIVGEMSSFVALPVIGLYFSLRCRFVLTAWLLTLLVSMISSDGASLVIRSALAGRFVPGPEGGFEVMLDFVVGVSCELGVAALLFARMKRILARRTFSFRTS